MNLLLQSSSIQHPASIKITGSKSETNRLLLLQALYPNLTLENTSNSDDSEVMQKALNSQFTIHNSQLPFVCSKRRNWQTTCAKQFRFREVFP
mgnify:CR=1 FL=1